MNLIVVNSGNIGLGKCYRYLLSVLSLIGEDLAIRRGDETTLYISTTPKPSVEKPPKSDKSVDSEKPESQPLKLRIDLKRHSNGATKAIATLQDATGNSVAVVSRSLSLVTTDPAHLVTWRDMKEHKASTVNVPTSIQNTSRKPTNTDTTYSDNGSETSRVEPRYSKDELLTRLRRSGVASKWADDMGPRELIEHFINEL